MQFSLSSTLLAALASLAGTTVAQQVYQGKGAFTYSSSRAAGDHRIAQ
jgi:hypothetical protein